MGENAAGKSTLMKILCGIHQPDSGKIVMNGQQVAFRSPADALKAGIGMVYQHFRLVEELTVLENILLSVSMKGYQPIRKRAAINKISALLDFYGFKIDPHDKVKTLSVGEKQLVEITRILFLDVDVLIMDEPTAVLSEFEKEKLFSVLRQLKEQGKAIVFISHNLNEVIQLCDDITVFRKGQNSFYQQKGILKNSSDNLLHNFQGQYNKDTILREMLGGDYQHFSGTEFKGIKQQVLRVDDLNLVSSEGQLLSDINFELCSGHITGIAGFAGNGQLQLFETIFSSKMKYIGTVFYHGKDIRQWSVVKKREAGIAYIPEDRLFHGSALTIPLMYNLSANRLEKAPYSKWNMINVGFVEQTAKELVNNYDIDTLSVKIPIGLLSGGNIQKAVIARETNTTPDLLLIHEPTRGLDSAAISFTYRILNDLKHTGTAILMASSNVEELMEVCDEIYVIYEGRFVHYAKKGTYDKQTINEHLAGFFEKHDERFLRKGNKYEA